jgi:transcriptional regulator EpsA
VIPQTEPSSTMHRPTPPPAGNPADLLMLSTEQAQAVVRLLESAPAVRRRHQFFVWTQSRMQALVPHQVMICGAYHRQRRGLVFDTFHSVVLSAELLGAISDAEGALARALTAAWVDGRGRPVRVALNRLDAAAGPAAALLREEMGCAELLVHGVSRPQRPAEIETLFIFGGPAPADGEPAAIACLDLLLPQLHQTWQRVVATEHELLRPPPAAAPPEPPRAAKAEPGAVRKSITPRECQILRWVRDGKSNQQIAVTLGISPLTVKNHVQKILRKLEASNRAQAVALAMDRGLLGSAEPDPTAPD